MKKQKILRELKNSNSAVVGIVVTVLLIGLFLVIIGRKLSSRPPFVCSYIMVPAKYVNIRILFEQAVQQIQLLSLESVSGKPHTPFLPSHLLCIFAPY